MGELCSGALPLHRWWIGPRPLTSLYNVRHSSSRPIRIGCGSGFWGDTPTAVPQLVKRGNLDFLALDYLSEVTMSLLVGAQRKKPELGWCPDFAQTMALVLPDIKKQGIRVVTNAGGVNPKSCMSSIMSVAAQLNVDLKVAVVTGDDAMNGKINITDTDCPSPSTIASANAYLGAGPITRALELGADIVVTGRCTDSALVLGPLIHSFRWDANNFDLMAKGSLAGHLVECGAQATGGIFTDWEQVTGWENNGFPIAVCEPSGDFVITKPKGTGGLVSRGTVAEQLVYEIHDPACYILPDVVCDFSNVCLEETEDGVRVTGACGRPPTPFYKVGGTYQDGWKCVTACPIIGPNAGEKGHKTANAIIRRCKGIFKLLNLPDFKRVHVQMLGMEESYGSNARPVKPREGVMWMSVHHSEKKALEIFAREIASAGTGMAPGLTTLVSGRPKPSPLLNFFSFLTPKENFNIQIELSTGHKETFVESPNQSAPSSSEPAPTSKASKDESDLTGTHSYKLSDLAFLRSGDKGDTCNIGVIARTPEIYPILKKHITAAVVHEYFQHKFPPGSTQENCQRFELPGVQGLNFVLTNSLGGGGIASLTPDPQGKAFAQQLADYSITGVPKLI
ncbi:hypothetical protein Ocin01_00190 [Orchesella cincta]|uniref:Terpene utilization protein AtuA n=1 Tax=Orchesella cincta TaxID=48709 RepID=A0A1D2NMN8_ORCCI|nr:hypothetical protein Ocin01_00190 [Orchesella cincta]